MKTSHVVIGLAALAGAAWYLSKHSPTATATKAADAPTPPTTTATGSKVASVTSALQGIIGAAGKLIGAFTGKAAPTTTPTTDRATTTGTARAADMPPSLSLSNQVQLT
jgi:hypothetical protein